MNQPGEPENADREQGLPVAAGRRDRRLQEITRSSYRLAAGTGDASKDLGDVPRASRKRGPLCRLLERIRPSLAARPVSADWTAI
jgi:hypothetical protein